MRVDFYQLSRDPAPAAIAMLARKILDAGQRLLVVGENPEQLEVVSEGLWQASPDGFLANARAGGAHDARQPILLSDQAEAANGARFLLFADGQWREAGDDFERVMLLFDDATIANARDTWRELGAREGVERHFWKQDGGRWVEGP